MKKKLLLSLLATVCAFCCMFGFAGCEIISGLLDSWNSANKPDNNDKYGNRDMVFNQSTLSLEVGDEFSLYITKTYFSSQEFEKYCPKEMYDNLCANGYTEEEIVATIMPFYSEFISDDDRIATVYANETAGIVTAQSAGTTYIRAYTSDNLHQAVCQVTVTDTYKEPDKNPEQPENPIDTELVFEFYDVTSDDGYPYLESMKTGMRGQTITFNTDGTCTIKAGSSVTTVNYTRNGNIFTVSTSGGEGEYVLEDDILSCQAEMSDYHITMYFKLKTAEPEPKYDELAGKTFAFTRVTSTILDANTVNTLNSGYKNATASFRADGSVIIYNPSDSIDTEPNAYSLQTGIFSCENGEGYITINYMTAGGEPVADFMELHYTLSFDGTTLTLFAAEMTFTYTLND